MTFLLILILILSTYRFTHLVVSDQIPIVRRPREWVVGKWPESNFAYLLNCTFCSSVWVAAAHVGALYIWTPESWNGVPSPVILGAALSAGTVIIETIVEAFDAYILKAD